LNYLLEESDQQNGYQMWSWSPEPPITVDVSAYTHFVIHIKADVAIEDAIIVLRDEVGELDNGSHYTINIGTEWQEIAIPLNDFTIAEGFEELADLSQLHLVRVMFDFDVTSVAEAEVHMDGVGFSTMGGTGDIAYVVDDFEHIPLNVMHGGEEDDSYMVVVPNPDMESGNDSEHVVMFKRSQFGVPWGGFWSALPVPIDLTDHKYIMVDVWKPRISPLKFKVEGGDTENLEIESMQPQTKVGEWETIVFDFSEKTGEWAVIAFMPDFADPLDLDEDIVIYFDNIRLSEEPLSAPDVSVDQFGVKVYPNPASAYVRVETDPGALVNLMSISGSIIDSRRAESSGVRFTVADLPAGVYFIRVIHRGTTVSEKFIVY
jgi:hypothetical protein